MASWTKIDSPGPRWCSNFTNRIAECSAIHLDIENWIDSGASTTWVDPLIATYTGASDYIDGSVPLVADMNGAKIPSATTTQRQAILDITDKLVLMQYQVDA